jgi:hypothetical protein
MEISCVWNRKQTRVCCKTCYVMSCQSAAAGPTRAYYGCILTDDSGDVIDRSGLLWRSAPDLRFMAFDCTSNWNLVG